MFFNSKSKLQVDFDITNSRSRGWTTQFQISSKNVANRSDLGVFKVSAWAWDVDAIPLTRMLWVPEPANAPNGPQPVRRIWDLGMRSTGCWSTSSELRNSWLSRARRRVVRPGAQARVAGTATGMASGLRAISHGVLAGLSSAVAARMAAAVAWYVSNVSIIFDAPWLFMHHLLCVLLHFVAFLCSFRN
jgi:hypothetical protein